MPALWHNPEFARHRRSELRSTRALTIALVVIAICVLVALFCWVSRQQYMEAMRRSSFQFHHPTATQLQEMELNNTAEFWKLFYRSLMWMQAGVLTFWCLLSCAQAVSGERERKTWDFQRTTRLTPAELAIGKLLGEPVVAYFIVICCFPIGAFAAFRGGIGIGVFFSTYLVMVASALFLGMAGLWISSMLESRSRGIGLIGTFGLYAVVALMRTLDGSNFPGLAALSPITGLSALLEGGTDIRVPARLFGTAISWLAASLLLYLTFGVWFAIMLLRNIRRDYDQIRPLSRSQAVACVAFLNFTLCAFFYPPIWQNVDSHDFATFMVVFNAVVLFAMGLAILTPYERLKVWAREPASGQTTLFSEDGLPWPWLALSAGVGYALVVYGLFSWKWLLGFDPSTFKSSAVQFLVVLIFITRDVLFMQWCTLTRLRSPLVKGVLYLSLYYVAAFALTSMATMYSESAGQSIASLLTPAGVFDTRPYGFHFPRAAFLGVGLQLAVIGIILASIMHRLRRPVVLMAAD